MDLRKIYTFDKNNIKLNTVRKVLDKFKKLKFKSIKEFKEVFSEENIELLEDGDLVISTAEFSPDKISYIPAGQIFEFKEEYTTYINSPLLKPNQKQIIEYTINKEYNELKENIIQYQGKENNLELKFILLDHINTKLRRIK